MAITVQVNDEPCALAIDPNQTVRDLAGVVCGDGADKRLVVGMRCNGAAVTAEEMDACLASVVGSFESIELQTRPVSVLVSQALVQAIDVLRAADAARIEVADLFTRAQQQSGFEKLQQLLADYKQVQETVLLSAEALNLQLDAITTSGRGMQEIVADIKTQLEELKTALGQGDLVLVGDILRYELETPFADWLAWLEEFRGQCAG